MPPQVTVIYVSWVVENLESWASLEILAQPLGADKLFHDEEKTESTGD